MRLGTADTALTSFLSDVEMAHSIGPSADPTTSAARTSSIPRLYSEALPARMSVIALPRHAAGEAHVEHAQADVRQQDCDRPHRRRSDVDSLDRSSKNLEAQRSGG